ncbi:MAG: hypothetical protein WBD75_00275 [Phycisphaerae bacterium]
MSQDTSWEMRQGLPGEGRLGVMDALSMGWHLLKGDFWALWVVALVMVAILMGCGIFGVIPYIGGCISLAVQIFIQPPLMAGLFFVISRRIDGAKPDVAMLFEGFRQRYWQSVVALLPIMLAGVAIGIVAVGCVIAVVAATSGFEGGEPSEEEMAVIMTVMLVVMVPLVLAVAVFQLFFLFALIAVWEHPESGWEAAKASMRLVKDHFWSALGFALLCGLIAIGASLAGMLACCVGVFFTGPAVSVWFAGSTIYLYRSWTGRPLVQPRRAGGGAVTEGGPIPPTDIQPPSAL